MSNRLLNMKSNIHLVFLLDWILIKGVSYSCLYPTESQKSHLSSLKSRTIRWSGYLSSKNGCLHDGTHPSCSSMVQYGFLLYFIHFGDILREFGFAVRTKLPMQLTIRSDNCLKQESLAPVTSSGWRNRQGMSST